MRHKPLGNAVAALLLALASWSVTETLRPSQAETASNLEGQTAAHTLSIPSVSGVVPTAGSTLETVPETDLKTDIRSGVAKVGESASQTTGTPEKPAIAKVFSHSLDGKQAATVYVRNIPVLTFITDDPAAAGDPAAPSSAAPTEQRKLATSKTAASPEQPLWKAAKLVAEFNRLNREGQVQGEDISVRWQDDRYLIEHGDRTLVTLDKTAILPDSTGAAAEDALQATNRLRRLLGPKEAPALKEVADMPAPPPAPKPQVVARSSNFYQQGEASWYGPGFHGRTSASGETFNQWAMTAAHKSLPFGTYVRVTNVYTGASVDVRINDRGPYAHGRVIDLSAAAADAIGMGGVAQVRIDVLR